MSKGGQAALADWDWLEVSGLGESLSARGVSYGVSVSSNWVQSPIAARLGCKQIVRPRR